MMRNLFTSALLSAVVLTGTCAYAMPPITRNDAITLGRKDTQLLLQGKTNALWVSMDAEMKSALKNIDALNNVTRQITSQFGPVTAMLHEDALPVSNTLMTYTRILKFRDVPTSLILLFAYTNAPTGAEDKATETKVKIGGFFLRPEPNPAPTVFLNYRDKTPLEFPLHDTWVIYQGGRTVGENYHAALSDERFAYDIVILKDGALYKGDGGRNDDWFSFDQPVYAAAAGKVITATNQYADNTPRKPSDDAPKQGNAIVIDQGRDEFAMYAHLKQGSVAVKPEDVVKAGQLIGYTGNSGNSPISHLHFHLQNRPTWLQGDGLPMQFSSLKVNGHPSTTEPVRGDEVESQ